VGKRVASNGVKWMMAGGSYRWSRSGEVAANRQKQRDEYESKKRRRQHKLAKSQKPNPRVHQIASEALLGVYNAGDADRLQPRKSPFRAKE
jgi:hypothetical protein